MILHIAHDNKFIDIAINRFEKIENGNNIFFILMENTENELKFITSKKINKISYQGILNEKFITKLEQFELIIIHYLSFNAKKFVLKVPKYIPIAWIGWGADYYNFIYKDINKLYLEKTRALLLQNNSHSLKKYIKILAYQLDYKSLFLIKPYKAIRRINFFAPVLYEEYEMLKKSVIFFKAKYVPFNYIDLDSRFVNNVEIDGNDILLGNSSTYENNHIEAMILLSKFNLQETRVITPLSYGDMTYQKSIISIGNRILDSSFFPLTNFLSVDKYTNTIKSCSIVVMNHIRQQGFGNIVTMLYLGAKIYLNKKNPIYKFLNIKGAFIFSIDDLSPDNPHALERLSLNKVMHNRKIILKHRSEKVLTDKTIELLKIVRNTL